MNTSTLTLFASVLLVVQSGCATSSSGKPEAEASLPAAKEASVLMRVPQESKLIFRVANQDRSESLHRIRPLRVRSAEFAKRGWVSLRLKPGIYHLQVRDARFHRTFVGLPRYRLYVSPRRSLSYAGTFLSISAYDFRLRDERADDYLYDRTLKISSEFRKIKDYSAKEGRARLGDDLSKAVQSGVKLFLAEASLASPTADKPEFANEQ